ncbi:MAG TPA: LysE family transporter [Ferruginibacter sp.]|nr:LysE family transporter [Ferruginibacter sp.]HRE63499.1 LysE family transporter [Ferruginibacter sp.]
MSAFFKVFFWGLLISFLGTLPMGTLNVTAMQIGIQESVQNALLFVLGSLTVEMVYVRLSLVGINWVRKQEKLMQWMQWITLFIIVLLAAGSIIAALQPDEGAKNVVLQNNIHRTLLGMGMCAINPVQIPFWFGWSTVLFTKGILKPVNAQYNWYIVGIGLGTLMGNALFIFGGKFVAQRINNSTAYINWVIGVVFIITAIVQLYKILNKKGAADKIHDIKDEEVLKMEK